MKRGRGAGYVCKRVFISAAFQNIEPSVLRGLCGNLRGLFCRCDNSKSQLKEDVRFRVLRHLQKIPDLSQRENADAVGNIVGSSHCMLKALIDRGLVKLGNFSTSDDKRRYSYNLTPKGLPEKPPSPGAFSRTSSKNMKR